MKVIGAMLMATGMSLLGVGSTWYYVKNVHSVYDFSCIESTDQELIAQHDRRNYTSVLLGGIVSGLGCVLIQLASLSNILLVITQPEYLPPRSSCLGGKLNHHLMRDEY